MIDTKTRIVAIVGSLALLLLIIDLVRRRKLKEEYSVLWVAAALSLLVMAAWYQLLGWITTAIGGVALSSTLFFFALLFVFFMLLHYSVRISALERRLTALVQEVGLSTIRAPRPVAGSTGGASASRVAVVIPCHDDGRHLGEAVASVQEQEAVEIIVVDDGSRDPRTLAVLDELSATGVRVLRQDNGGPGAARTAGLRATSSAYVYPLDADDLLEPGALSVMADELESHPEAGFAWGDYVLFGEDDGYYRSPESWLPWTLTYVNPYPVASLFRRTALERAGAWRGRDYEDWDLWLKLVDAGIDGLRVDRAVYRRRMHGDGRQLQGDRQRHQRLYDQLQQQHAELFARRLALRRAERPAGWKRVAYPIVFGARTIVPLPVERMLQRTMMRLGTGLPG